MQDAHYYRSQAELLLEVARQLSDAASAERARAAAAHYYSKAVDLEKAATGGGNAT